MRKEADDTGPFAELEHWRHLMSRFNSLIEQIRSHDCKVVIQILHVAKSKILKVSSAFNMAICLDKMSSVACNSSEMCFSLHVYS